MRAAELEQALLLLPYSAACELLTRTLTLTLTLTLILALTLTLTLTRCELLERLLPLLEEAPPAELMTRCVLFVLKVHPNPDPDPDPDSTLTLTLT